MIPVSFFLLPSSPLPQHPTSPSSNVTISFLTPTKTLVAKNPNHHGPNAPVRVVVVVAALAGDDFLLGVLIPRCQPCRIPTTRYVSNSDELCGSGWPTRQMIPRGSKFSRKV